MKTKIIVLTQCYSCGSWLCIEEILNVLNKQNKYKIIVIGLGNHSNKLDREIQYISIPYPRYDRWGIVTTLSPIVSFLWHIPLYLAGIFALIFYKPRLFIFNGLASGLVMSPVVKIFHGKTILMFHSFIGKYSQTTKEILTKMTDHLDLVVVNSKGSADDIQTIFPIKKIVINKHHADDIFFEKPILKTKINPLTITYVGRLDNDKQCLPLINIAKKLQYNKDFHFLFVGVGSYESDIKKLVKNANNIKYLGYISDRIKLRSIYRKTSVLWSFADETYLGLPAIEALACGVPIIIPNIPALGTDKPNSKIPRKLVPSEIGWLIDAKNEKKTLQLLIDIKHSYPRSINQKKCREFCRVNYGKINIENTIESINSLNI